MEKLKKMCKSVEGARRKPILSIVVPVFNTRDYLDACLTSILTNLHNADVMQVLVIDDGSPDDAGEIADAFASKYDWVQAIHKRNGGLSSARNEGLRASIGDYILFLDSDDVLFPGSLNHLLGILDETAPDLIYFEHDLIDEEGDFLGVDPLEKWYPDEGSISSDRLLSLVLDGRIANYSWKFVAKRALYMERRVAFPEQCNFEDIATTYRIIMQSSNCLIDRHCLVRYRQRSGSILHSDLSQLSRSYLDAEKALCDRVQTIGEFCPEQLRKARRSRACFFLWASWDNHHISPGNRDEVYVSFNRFTDAMMKKYVKADGSALKLRDFIKYLIIRSGLIDTFVLIKGILRRK